MQKCKAFSEQPINYSSKRTPLSSIFVCHHHCLHHHLHHPTDHLCLAYLSVIITISSPLSVASISSSLTYCQQPTQGGLSNAFVKSVSFPHEMQFIACRRFAIHLSQACTTSINLCRLFSTTEKQPPFQRALAVQMGLCNFPTWIFKPFPDMKIL